MLKQILKIYLFFFIMTNQVSAEEIFRDDFEDSSKWKFIADDVMGGLSTGSVVYEMEEGTSIAYLNGEVTTENNGGFIQLQRKLKDVDLDQARFIKIIARGNNQKYFIHLRTTGTILPWQYYQSSFTVKENYQEFILPLDEFKRSGSFLSDNVKPRTIKSIGVVAFGRDHVANLYVKEISFIK
tara:strand:- start:44 stop:592 length:549 start_codon:yes stop_codon:yes gene_type:complete